MKVACPKCQREIPSGDVNVSADVAFCRACNEAFELSDLVEDEDAEDDAPPPEMMVPPRGTWFEKDLDGFTVGATTRSAIAFFLVPFMCVWSGGSLGGIYGSQIASGKFNLGMSLFGIPFLLGTLLFGSIALMSVCGKVTVTVRRGEGVVFTGIGPVGWRKRFIPSQIRHVREQSSRGSKGSTTWKIVLQGSETVELGSGLTDERRRFMVQVLRFLLAGPSARGQGGSSA
jgi:hypothetical protein